jgi:hypothetical protein
MRPAEVDDASHPKVSELRWRQFRISHHVLNVFVTEVGLYRASVMTTVCELVAAGVPEHVWVNGKVETSGDAKLRDDLVNAVGGERRAAFRGEDVCSEGVPNGQEFELILS